MAEREGFLRKSEQSLAGAESEYQFSRYDNCVNRCYYACFQAAVYALASAGIVPRSRDEYWGHDFVRAEFNGQLIYRRKLYPPDLREAFERTFAMRRAADYQEFPTTGVQAQRALQRARMFVGAIRQAGENR